MKKLNNNIPQTTFKKLMALADAEELACIFEEIQEAIIRACAEDVHKNLAMMCLVVGNMRNAFLDIERLDDFEYMHKLERENRELRQKVKLCEESQPTPALEVALSEFEVVA